MKKLLLTLTIIGSLYGANAQNTAQFENFLNASVSDAAQYLEDYTRPIVLSTSNGLANGWYTSGKPHKLFGFDITATVSVASIPQGDYSFIFRNSDYQTIQLQNGTEAEVPTFIGASNPGVTLENSQTGETFQAASGLGIDIPVINPGMPVPMANIGVGLPKNTELRVRFLPIPDLGDGVSFQGTFGIGVLHDIKQWIPGMKLVPIDISGFIGYNKFSFEYVDADNVATFNTNSTTVQVVAAKKLLFFTPYIGAGFNILNSDVTYEYTGTANVPQNRVDLAYDNLGGARFTVGAQLKILWVLALNIDYTFQKYNTVNVGFGINIR